MHKLKILVLEQSEITTIADACRFLAVPSDISIEVHSLSEQLSGLDLPRLNPIPAANMKSLCRSFYSSSAKPSALVKEILFFSSLAVHKQLAEFQKQQSPTLYIHPDLAIMELSAPLTLHQAFPDWAHAIRPSTPTHQHALTPTQHFVDNAVEPCILAGDSAHGFLPEGFCPTVYPEISAYLKAKVPNQVLLTANHHLIMALLAMDEENWSIFHPECCVRNLALDVCSNPQSSALYGLNQAIRQLSRLVSTPTSAFDFAGIRHAKQADKHAYSFFARHYDEYMAHVDYELWITRIL
ncbi:MAG: hypothetical protein RBS43_08265, partial [Candidatus Cloacimonas sp.]|nr:hypothetical protein [Candidatus Cloacimonas sp.]